MPQVDRITLFVWIFNDLQPPVDRLKSLVGRVQLPKTVNYRCKTVTDILTDQGGKTDDSCR